MLSVSDVKVRYSIGGSVVKALDGVDLSLDSGDFLTVIGANGAGKTTLVNVIAGTVRPDEGTVILAGEDVRRVPEHRRAKKIARVFHHTTNSICGELTIEENLMLALTRSGRRWPWRPALGRQRRRVATEALERYAPKLVDRLKQHARSLSSGQGQLLAIVMAVIAKPEVLLLDEHTSALDPSTSEAVMQATRQIVEQERIATLMITHQMRIAANYGGDLIMMGGGRVVDRLGAEEAGRRDEATLIERFRAAATSGLSDRMLA
jgi:putative tryptophan/tyrosine transport system ATP-binding protein